MDAHRRHHDAEDIMRTPRPIWSVTVGLSILAGLTACSADPASTSAQSSEPASPSPTQEPVAVSVDGYVWGKPVSIDVGPVVVDDGIGILHLTITGDDPRSASIGLGNALFSLQPGPSGVRLVDLDAMTVSVPAQDGKNIVMSSEDSTDGAVRTTVAFAAPDDPTTAALIPGIGLVEGVPVIDEAGGSLAELTDASAAELLAATYPLETFTQSEAIATRTSAEDIAVAVDSDVLFAIDSAELSPNADTTLAAAAAQITGYPGGTLTIIGHTDDVGDAATNQVLSEQRAQAVSDRLASLADLSAYTVTVEGRGEDEPAVHGTTDADRALNRRVELLFVPSGGRLDEPTTPSSGETPPAMGPVVADIEPVVVTSQGKDYQVRVDGVRRSNGVLVGTFEITTTANGTTGLLASGPNGTRGGFAPMYQSAASRVTLLDGSTRTYPMDYANDGADGFVPLADRVVTTRPDGPTTVTVIWPDPGTDVVTIDVPPVTTYSSDDASHPDWPPFRFVDVPVTQG